MGNKSLKEETGAKKNDGQKVSKVNPFREGAPNVSESKLRQLLKQSGVTEDEEQNDKLNLDQLKQFKEDQFKIENIQLEIVRLEEQIYSSERLGRIREDFENFSKENKMSRKKLLEYFGMQELENKKLGNRIFQCVKSTFSAQKTGPFLDYPKFLKSVSMLQTEDSRLKFLYQMFDLNLDGTIERDEMFNIMMMFLEGLMTVNYENAQLEELKHKISDFHDREIEMAVEDLVNEIYSERAKQKQNIMNYNEWKEWILEQRGVPDILQFK